jgi:hypothetical protein
MRRRSPLALVLLLAVLLAACGGTGSTMSGGGFKADPNGGGSQPAAFDPRDEPLKCIQSKGVQAEKSTQSDQLNVVTILPATSGAEIRWLATPTQTESAQLANQYPGSEMIGPAAFQVGNLSDNVAQKIEKCLEAQGSTF